MEVRTATTADAEAVAALNAAAWRRGFAGIVSAEYLETYDGVPERRREQLEDTSPNVRQLVAETGGRVVGWVMGCPSGDAGVYEVRACYVAPQDWRTGTGRILLSALLDALAPDAWHDVVLWTPRDATATRRFHAAQGFDPDGAEKVIDRLGPVPLVRLRRPLR